MGCCGSFQEKAAKPSGAFKTRADFVKATHEEKVPMDLRGPANYMAYTQDSSGMGMLLMVAILVGVYLLGYYLVFASYKGNKRMIWSIVLTAGVGLVMWVMRDVAMSWIDRAISWVEGLDDGIAQGLYEASKTCHAVSNDVDEYWACMKDRVPYPGK